MGTLRRVRRSRWRREIALKPGDSPSRRLHELQQHLGEPTGPPAGGRTGPRLAIAGLDNPFGDYLVRPAPGRSAQPPRPGPGKACQLCPRCSQERPLGLSTRLDRRHHLETTALHLAVRAHGAGLRPSQPVGPLPPRRPRRPRHGPVGAPSRKTCFRTASRSVCCAGHVAHHCRFKGIRAGPDRWSVPFTVTAAALLAFRAWQRGGGWAWFWALAAAATLTKGPLGLLFAANGLLAAWWERKSPRPHPLRGSQLPGVGLFLLLAGGWFLLAYWQAGPPLIA